MSIESRLETDKEAILAEDGISLDRLTGEGIGDHTTVKAGLTVEDGRGSSLAALVRVEQSEQLKLEACSRLLACFWN